MSTSRAPDSSVRIDDVGVQLGSCQAQTQNLSSSSPELVKFRSRTCHVRAQNLSRSSLKLVTFEPGTCQVLSWHLSGSILQLVQFEPTLIGHACMHIQSSLVSTKKSGANAQLRWRASALLRVNTTSRRLSALINCDGQTIK